LQRTGACQETEALLQGLADGVLDAAERAALEAHLAGCPACTAEAARLRDNAAFLQEVLGPFRLSPGYATDFLFKLPRKDPRRRAAPAPAAASRTMVLGDGPPRRRSPLLLAGGACLLGAGGFLAWSFLSGPGETVRIDRQRTLPDVQPRDAKGDGPADAKRTGPAPVKPGPGGTQAGGTGAPRAPGGGGTEPIRSAADLLATLRGVRGEAFGPVIQRGWDLLAGSPPEAKAARDLAGKEKDPRVRAALVLCLGADGGPEARAAAREFLGDEAPEVRTAAVLALARALSFDSPGKRPEPTGPPLGAVVQVGALADDPGRADLAARLGAESDPLVRRAILVVLAHAAGADPAIRDRLLEGVGGAWGDDLRETSLRSLQGVQDPVVAEKLAELIPGAPKALHAALVEAMVAADARTAADRLGDLLAKAEGTELRKLLVGACSKAGGAAAQKALVEVLGGDQDASVRLAALSALQRFPSKEVLEAVVRAENDADQGVRQEAERVAKILRESVNKTEGGQENPPADNPPPAPAPAPAPDGN
jgi:HEAT repeat protein